MKAAFQGLIVLLELEEMALQPLDGQSATTTNADRLSASYTNTSDRAEPAPVKNLQMAIPIGTIQANNTRVSKTHGPNTIIKPSAWGWDKARRKTVSVYTI